MTRSTIFTINALLVLTLFGCKPDENTSPTNSLFSEIKADDSNIHFNNLIQEDIDFHHLNWESVYNGGGVATADFDNDGLEDIYFTGNQVDDAIYKNLGNLQFEDRSDASGINIRSGWSTGVSVADVNQDGWLDIYVCRMWHESDEGNPAFRKNCLFINNQDFTFTEKASEFGLADQGHGTQASFFDFDQDGDLDMYLLNAPSNNYNQKLVYIKNNSIPYAHSDKLFRNDDGKFIDITKEAGVIDYGFGLGITTQDYNNDGWTDIYVANDFETADRMFINQKDGTFKDLVQSSLKHISFSSMGTDANDMNNDGLLDIAVLDMQSADHYRSKTNMPSMDIQRFWTNVARGQHYQYMSNMLQINNGYGFYSEVAQLAGIASTDWSWSILLADLDNDSQRDIYITNGLNKDIRNNDFAEEMLAFRARGPKSLFEFSQKVGSQKISNLAFRNQKNTLIFEDNTVNWGLNQKGFSYGASYVDLDNDGDLDLVVNNNNALASVYENHASKNTSNHFIQIVATENGLAKENVKVRVYADDQQFFNEQSRIRGYQSSVSVISHFGLGAETKIDSIKLEYGNKIFMLRTYEIDKLNVVKLEDINWKTKAKIPSKPTLLKEVTTQVDLKYIHKENSFNDFNRETLLPHMQSKNGPYIETNSINEESYVYIGNSHDAETGVFQFKNKQFSHLPGPWQEDQAYEDQGASFFDADNDGDLDLIVASGGGEKANGDALYRDRLYMNNGTSWTKKDALPSNFFNSSVVRTSDFDNDGDQDIFIGGHTIPGGYPQASASQLLVNEAGKFVDKTIEFASELRKVGMVNDAIWTSLNDDDFPDLIVVGEFMRPRFFENNGRQLIDKTDKYLNEELGGWWFSIKEADLDKDGVMEYIIGNIGENNKFHPSSKKPLKIYGNDFDKNNTNDIVLTKTTEKYGEVPVRGRQCSSEQMPFIKKKFESFDDFASADIVDIFGKKNLAEGVSLSATEFSSGYLKKEGDHFKFIAFPDMAQISAIRGIETDDLNYDGLLDIICVGNVYDAEVETTRHDASNGMVLIQQNDGTFEVINVTDSGFYSPGNARKIIKLGNKDQQYFMVSNNQFINQIIEKNPPRK